MLVFDTTALPAGERTDAMTAVIQEALLATHVEHATEDAPYLRVQRFPLGAVELVDVESSRMRITRAPRRRGDDPPLVSIGVQRAGGTVQIQDSQPARLGGERVFALEMTRPYDHRSSGALRGSAVTFSAEQLGLPVDLVAHARTRLARSPIHDVFLRHFQTVRENAEAITDDRVAAMVGSSTIELGRALIASVTGDETRAREALADTLVVRVKSYVQAHLHDVNLQPAAIAAAHHVSVRHLYKVCSQADLRLEQWIISERLEHARAELARPESSGRTIATTALRWGFSNSSHFTHRFRSAYGMTPREWQRLRAETR